MTPKDGGPAFPHLGLYMGADGNMHPTPTQYEGLSLRDWFAGQAAVGFLCGASSLKDEARAKGMTAAELTARASYMLADAMLKEREASE